MILDRSQQEIVDISGSHALVLAGPGCGKTHILARRIIEARSRDAVDFADMACLTFTNRASREMNRRILAELGYMPDGLFIGNIHRFCIRFLYENALLADDMTVIDEDDRDLWLSETLGVRRDFDRKCVLDTAILLYQQEHDFPAALRRRLSFKPDQSHIRAATAYRDFKTENRLVDFDDLLLLTYDALSRPHTEHLRYCAYRWIQVDEVQDLTPLQLAIIDLITAPGRTTAVYFGDEQQAIFEFIGAGGPALDKLKERYRDSTFRLRRNYRSAPYLVSLCNDFAATCMALDRSGLPECDSPSDAPANSLQLLMAGDWNLTNAVAAKAREWLADPGSGNIALLVRTNDEAEDISALLSAHGISHNLISRKDLFRRPAYKTLFAHFAVLSNPMRLSEWAALLFRTKSVATLAEARSFVYTLRKLGATPADLISSDGQTALTRLTLNFSQSDVVVVDTETTGLDPATDDVIQIAAVRYHNGCRVDDGGFEVLIATDRPIPPMLGDGTPNPMLAAMRTGHPLPADEALAAFASYADGAVICAHNATFDCAILRANYRRRATVAPPRCICSEPIDTLAIARLLYPFRRSYRLESLIQWLGIQGVNSHNAVDDVAATTALLERLYTKASEMTGPLTQFLQQPLVSRIRRLMDKNYRPVYENSRSALDDSSATLPSEMDLAYRSLTESGFIPPIDRWTEVLRFIDATLADSACPSFYSQLHSRLYELRTFNEGDLIDSAAERLTVLTVHKAKGLEFDDVIIFNACERTFRSSAESDRVFYVAFSRARRRLALFCAGPLATSVAAVSRHFTPIPPAQVEASALLERLHSPRR